MSEALISVDIEASGPIPGRYSMLSIGGCPIDDLEDGFYLELQPISLDFLPAALEVSHLDMDQLRSNGTPPDAAMLAFADWLSRFVSPIFVGFNAAFDWAFVNHYFVMYFNGANPFGFCTSRHQSVRDGQPAIDGKKRARVALRDASGWIARPLIMRLMTLALKRSYFVRC